MKETVLRIEGLVKHDGSLEAVCGNDLSIGLVAVGRRDVAAP